MMLVTMWIGLVVALRFRKVFAYGVPLLLILKYILDILAVINVEDEKEFYKSLPEFLDVNNNNVIIFFIIVLFSGLSLPYVALVYFPSYIFGNIFYQFELQMKFH